VSVTAPMSTASCTVTPASTAIVWPNRWLRSSSAPPTSSDAAPPNPLSRATICGIDVIFTERAIHSPSAPPTTSPAAITVYEMTARSTSVMAMASSMPMLDSRLPARAVAGLFSRLSPSMKRTAAAR